MFTSITRTVNAWRRAGAVRRELSHLSDRELADIGITRSDIDRIAEEEAQEATHVLAVAAAHAMPERHAPPLRAQPSIRS
jgi:uncharacterized protein YjiS (DUF1127 family)